MQIKQITALVLFLSMGFIQPIMMGGGAPTAKKPSLFDRASALHSELVELLHTQEAQKVISTILKHIKQ